MSQRKARQRRRLDVEPAASGGSSTRRPLLIVAVSAVVTVVVAFGVMTARSAGEAAPVVETSDERVAFSGTDPITGERVSLSDYTGKPVVINIWGSWCHGCIAEAEDLRQFAADHPEAPLIGIDLQDSRSGARDFYADFGWTHPSVWDPAGEISYSLGLQGTPTTLFLDRRHRVRSRIIGETDYAGFEAGLEEALSAS
jgi:thiol-disulfide isomerase/thioredoxin